MRREDCFYLGSIRKAHGILGEVKAYLDVDDISLYEDKESVYLLREGKLTPFFVEKFRAISDNIVILSLRGLQTRSQAEEIYASEMYLPLDELPKLSEGQFYYHEIDGFTVSDSQMGELGKVIRVDEMPAQDLIVMSYKGKEVLLPVTDDFVLGIDHHTQKVLTNLPEGLLDIYIGTDEPS